MQLKNRTRFGMKYNPAFKQNGFTLIELMIVIAIIGTLAAIGAVLFAVYIENARVSRAIIDIKTIAQGVMTYELFHPDNEPPNSLSDIDMHTLLDPWGNPYEYQNFNNIPSGKKRKNRNLVPLNSRYDIWSNGKDGKSQPPITSNLSEDDIIWANDGQYVGLASKY